MASLMGTLKQSGLLPDGIELDSLATRQSGLLPDGIELLSLATK